MTELHQPPLMGFHWNLAEVDASLNRGLLTIIAHDLHGEPHAIGTGFIISRDDRKAMCVSAAHVFGEVRRLQSPPQRHSRSALSEFLPPPKVIDIDRKSLRVVSVEGDRVESLVVEGVTIDESTDIAFFSVALQDSSKEPFFSHEFLVDGTAPSVGELVVILSFGDMGICDGVSNGAKVTSFKLGRRTVMRVGRVLAHYPDGHRLCRGPCIETSIPVYSGMSGGPIFRFGTEGAMRPFGLVCSDPDMDGENKQNRSIEGHSICALLNCQNSFSEDGKHIAKLSCAGGDAAGLFRSQCPPN